MNGTTGVRLLAATSRLFDAPNLRWVLTGIVHGKAQVRLEYMKGLTLVPEEDLEHACAAALELFGGAVSSPRAAYVEFGVYIGTSMACMHRAAARKGADGLRLIGFDSFQGIPKGVEEQDDRRFHEGELYSDVELTRTNLRRLGVPLKRVELIPGWFEESLPTKHAAGSGS